MLTVIPPTTLQIEPVEVTLLEGEDEPLSTHVTGPGGESLSGWPVDWSTAHPEVALVSGSGTLHGVSEGATIARAEVEGVFAEAPVTVMKGPTLAFGLPALQLAGRSGDADPIRIPVRVENAGHGRFASPTVSTSTSGPVGAAWLAASLSPVTADGMTLLVQADLADLAAGAYSGTVTVSDPAAVNGPQSLPVELQVDESLPSIRLDPDMLPFNLGAGTFEPIVETVTVTNTGSGVLEGLRADVFLESGRDWLTASFAGEDAPTTLRIEVSARFLGVGTYVAHVTVRAASAPSVTALVTVVLTIR